MLLNCRFGDMVMVMTADVRHVTIIYAVVSDP